MRLLLPLLLLFPGVSASAAETRVAVAANFAEPAAAIAAAFARATGHRVLISVGPSGGLYTQVTQGAPYDLLLSADAERPIRAEREGHAVRGSRFTYAIGRLVLWSANPAIVDGSGAVLGRGMVTRIAIADPETAPYGAAAVEVMTRLGVWPALKARTVTGASIAQAYQFVASGGAELGFVALSQVEGKGGGSRWLVPARLHRPILQQAVLLKRGRANPAAIAFHRFLRGPVAKAIIRRHGYGVDR